MNKQLAHLSLSRTELWNSNLYALDSQKRTVLQMFAQKSDFNDYAVLYYKELAHKY